MGKKNILRVLLELQMFVYAVFHCLSLSVSFALLLFPVGRDIPHQLQESVNMYEIYMKGNLWIKFKFYTHDELQFHITVNNIYIFI